MWANRSYTIHQSLCIFSITQENYFSKNITSFSLHLGDPHSVLMLLNSILYKHDKINVYTIVKYDTTKIVCRWPPGTPDTAIKTDCLRFVVFALLENYQITLLVISPHISNPKFPLNPNRIWDTSKNFPTTPLFISNTSQHNTEIKNSSLKINIPRTFPRGMGKIELELTIST